MVREDEGCGVSQTQLRSRGQIPPPVPCGVSALAERETTPVSRQNMISQVFEFCEKMNVPHEL